MSVYTHYNYIQGWAYTYCYVERPLRGNEDGHKQSLTGGESAVTTNTSARKQRKEAWVFAYMWLLPDREREGDILFARKASHPWRSSAFLKTFTLHLINRWTCSVVDFSERVLSLSEPCWLAQMLPQMAEAALAFQKSGKEPVYLSPSHSIPQVTFDAFG